MVHYMIIDNNKVCKVYDEYYAMHCFVEASLIVIGLVVDWLVVLSYVSLLGQNNICRVNLAIFHYS